ncbi:MAG TPA: hypothetical protein VEK07_05520, partial [Polyangiaceae bacterium]|nr:hypothetical protein [Polyangiaceae bacterium]
LTCVNEQSDNLNCGACGNACGAQEVCSSGSCHSQCVTGQTLCTPSSGSPYCADTQSDSANCGTCGNTCAAGQECSGGACHGYIQVFNKANTSATAQVFTVPASCSTVLLEAWGAGGGGNGSQDGGSGAVVTGSFTGLVAGATINVWVATGGTFDDRGVGYTGSGASTVGTQVSGGQFTAGAAACGGGLTTIATGTTTVFVGAGGGAGETTAGDEGQPGGPPSATTGGVSGGGEAGANGSSSGSGGGGAGAIGGATGTGGLGGNGGTSTTTGGFTAVAGAGNTPNTTNLAVDYALCGSTGGLAAGLGATTTNDAIHGDACVILRCE